MNGRTDEPHDNNNVGLMGCRTKDLRPCYVVFVNYHIYINVNLT